MTHLIMALYGSPDTHEDFMKKVNLWRYEEEGKFRKGKMAPYVSELKLYDVRLPESMINQFLTDCNAQTINSMAGQLNHIDKKNDAKHNWLRNLAVKLFNKLTKKLGIYPEYTPTGKKLYGLFGWHNFYVLAKIKDDCPKNVLTGEKREVL